MIGFAKSKPTINLSVKPRKAEKVQDAVATCQQPPWNSLGRPARLRVSQPGKQGLRCRRYQPTGASSTGRASHCVHWRFERRPLVHLGAFFSHRKSTKSLTSCWSSGGKPLILSAVAATVASSGTPGACSATCQPTSESRLMLNPWAKASRVLNDGCRLPVSMLAIA